MHYNLEDAKELVSVEIADIVGEEGCDYLILSILDDVDEQKYNDIFISIRHKTPLL